MAKKVKRKNNLTPAQLDELVQKEMDRRMPEIRKQAELEVAKKDLEDTAKFREKHAVKRSQAIASEGFVKAVEAQKAIPASAKRDQAANILNDFITATPEGSFQTIEDFQEAQSPIRKEHTRRLRASLVANTMAWLEESGYDLQELGQLQLTDDMDEVQDLYDAAASGDLQRMKQRYFQSQDKTNKRSESKKSDDFPLRLPDEMKKFGDRPGDRVDEVELSPRSKIQRDVEEAAAKEGQREV